MEIKPKLKKCRICGAGKAPHELFIYVDGNNISITRNSPELCYDCYIKKYGHGN